MQRRIISPRSFEHDSVVLVAVVDLKCRPSTRAISDALYMARQIWSTVGRFVDPILKPEMVARDIDSKSRHAILKRYQPAKNLKSNLPRLDHTA